MKYIAKKPVALIIPSLIRQVLILLTFGMLLCAYANTVTNNLATEIQQGKLTIDKIEGTGGSTGTVLNGYLINNTKQEIKLDVFLRDALYFLNSGKGQNMFVVGVLGKSGRYVRSGKKSFITLAPKKRTPVVFWSYCADFKKGNPSPIESFKLSTLPKNMKPLLRRIIAYHEQYPNKDITRAAQLAIWLAQGESASEIKRRFDYTQNDLNLAYRFVDK